MTRDADQAIHSIIHSLLAERAELQARIHQLTMDLEVAQQAAHIKPAS